jgi:hypothetical protein
MDVPGQEGDPDIPTSCSNGSIHQAGISCSSTRRAEGCRGSAANASIEEATTAYGDLLLPVSDGSLDPSQPVFRQDLED